MRNIDVSLTFDAGLPKISVRKFDLLWSTSYIGTETKRPLRRVVLWSEKLGLIV